MLISNRVASQDFSDEDLYSILFDQISIYADMNKLSSENDLLLQDAISFASTNDYQLAIIYLEELLFILQFSDSPVIKLDENNRIENIPGQVSGRPQQHAPGLRLSLVSGIDYNKQEFDIGYFESDSAILEQISRPYIGFVGGFIYQFNPVYSIELSNALRYDNDFLRNDYKITWRAGSVFALNFGGYWNQSNSILSSSFWEHELNARYYKRIAPTIALSIENNYRHKSYRHTSFYVVDYFRNRFVSVAEWSLFRFEYNNELNESLGSSDLDYMQHMLVMGIRNTPGEPFVFDLNIDLSLRKYTLTFDTNLINNVYNQLGATGYISFTLTMWSKLIIEENFIFKSYKEKNSLEPDYFWNLVRPGVVINFTSNFETTLGYEHEFRNHRTVSDDIFDVSEQNYSSNGLFLAFAYINSNGSYLSASVSHQWRRYPDSPMNDILSIYSNQNVLSLTMMAYWPIMTGLYLNTYVMYDTDQDIDIDQMNSQSTIITAELEYRF